jgi:very-short-patch-repair endonuclease
MFRRQRPVGNYIADFACLELWLVIKVDGATHLLEEIQIKDVKKEHDLQHAGFTVLRFTDEAVLKSINQVTEAIAQTVVALEELHPPVFGSIGNCPPPAFGHPRQRGRAATINY